LKENTNGKYNGGTCSIYGNNCVECVTHTFIIKDIVLDDLLIECYFMDENLSSDTMVPKHKMLLLYWWFSTNIYLICGRYNICKLHQCLIDAICAVYPNPIGVAYVGHTPSTKRKVLVKKKALAKKIHRSAD